MRKSLVVVVLVAVLALVGLGWDYPDYSPSWIPVVPLPWEDGLFTPGPIPLGRAPIIIPYPIPKYSNLPVVVNI